MYSTKVGYSVHLKGSKFIEKSKSMSFFYLYLHILYKTMMGQGRIISICILGLCLEFTQHELDGCSECNDV